jgi:hypothetical protein
LDELYKAAEKKYGKLPIVALEEKLANDFMIYAQGFDPEYENKHLNIFQRLWKAIKDLFNHTSVIDNLYRDINNGVYANRVLKDTNNKFSNIDPE